MLLNVCDGSSSTASRPYSHHSAVLDVDTGIARQEFRRAHNFHAQRRSVLWPNWVERAALTLDSAKANSKKDFERLSR